MIIVANLHIYTVIHSLMRVSFEQCWVNFTTFSIMHSLMYTRGCNFHASIILGLYVVS